MMVLLFTSQRQSCRVGPAPARKRPSGENTRCVVSTPVTSVRTGLSKSKRSLACPSVYRIWPVAASLSCTSGLGQNRIATRDPSGERARATGGVPIFHVFSPPAPRR